MIRCSVIFASMLVACTSGSSAPDASSDASGDASTTRALVVDHVEDLGAFPAPPTVAGRDGTPSALVGDQIIWTFGDTFLNKQTSDDKTNVRSSTAGWSAPDAALALVEPVDDAGIPFQLVPYTPTELAKNQADALDGGVALWPAGVIATSATSAIVFFQHVVRANGTFASDAVGTAHVTPPSNVASRDAAFLFQSPDPLFGNGGAIVDGGNVYLFDCEQILGFDFACKLARAPIASATTRSAYEFFDGTTFTSDITKAAPFIDKASYAVSIAFSPWLGRYLAVYGKPGSDDVGLRTADHVEGPWTDPEVVIPGSSSGFVTSDAGTNYLAQEHVELRSIDGKQIVISYAHPLPGFLAGACRLARIYFQ